MYPDRLEGGGQVDMLLAVVVITHLLLERTASGRFESDQELPLNTGHSGPRSSTQA